MEGVDVDGSVYDGDVTFSISNEASKRATMEAAKKFAMFNLSISTLH